MIHIVILNWNGWRDTLACLDSVFRLESPKPFSVVVCDNGSSDDSLARLRHWAQRRSDDNAARHVCISRAEAERGAWPSVPLVLVDNGANLGFAGGNNVALRGILRRDDTDYVWLLNNDTVVERGALSALLAKADSDSRYGMIGSTLLYYDRPDVVQAWGGGSLARRCARTRHLGVFEPASSVPDAARVEAGMDYVVGASMFVTAAFLRTVGPLAEDYFLYFEELDWACRRGHFTIGYAPDSIVYHKEGAAIGSSHSGPGSPLSIFFLYRSRLLFAGKFLQAHRNTVRVDILKDVLRSLKACQFRKAWIVMQVMLGQIPSFIPDDVRERLGGAMKRAS